MSSDYFSIKKIKQGYKKDLQYWCNRDARYFKADDINKLLLCIAARKGDLGIVTFLIEKEGVDPNEGYQYKTPLQYAIENKEIRTIDYLIEKCGGNVNRKVMIEHYEDRFPTLALVREPEMSKYLIDHGANSVISDVFRHYLDAFGIADKVNEYIMKSLKEAIDKKLEMKCDGSVIDFGDKETAERMFGKLVSELDNLDIHDGTIEILLGTVKDTKFQEIANKYKIGFVIYYQVRDIHGNLKIKDIKNFEPQ